MPAPYLAHYLPQSYLQGFTDLRPQRGRRPPLWVATPTAPKWTGRGVRSTASRRDYYLLRDGAGARDLTIEQALAQTEGDFVEAMRQTGDVRFPLGAHARGAIATFAATMRVRLPIQHERMSEFEVDVVKMTMQATRSVHGKTKESWEAYLKRMEAETGQSFEGLTPDGMDPEKYRITIPHERTIALAFSSVEKIAPLIGEMKWRFYYAAAPDSFVTSDQPLALYSPSLAAANSKWPPGLAEPRDVEMTLPLNRGVALHGTWEEGAAEWHHATTREVREINLRTAMYARDLYIASNPVFPGHEDVMRKIEAEAGQPKRGSDD